MRNTEFTVTVLRMLREGKTEKQIAFETQKHRNTISRHVNFLRQNFALDPQLLTNEVLSRLRERIDTMEDRDLVRFLSVLMPQKIEKKVEVKKQVDINVTQLLAEYEASLTTATNTNLQAQHTQEPVAQTQTNPETS
jgi:transposase